MVSLSFPLHELQTFMLVLARVAAILFAIPFLDSRSVPALFKAGLAVAASIMVYGQVQGTLGPFPVSVLGLFLAVGSEVLLGLAVGFMVKLIFAGLQLAGQLAGFQMGFAIANVVDPASSVQIPILAQFLNLFAMMIFLATDMHYWFFNALVDSFQIVAPMQLKFQPGLVRPVLQTASAMFVIALKVGAPVIVALILTHVALGLMARTVPQMQVFIVAMPLQIVVGIVFLGLSLPFWAAYMQDLFNQMGHSMLQVLKFF